MNPGWAVPSRRFRGGCLSLDLHKPSVSLMAAGDLVWDRWGHASSGGVPAWAFCHLDGGEQGIGAVAAAPWGSASILTISWIHRHDGCSWSDRSNKVAILNANRPRA